MLNDLLERRVIIVLGKGGVGKSTLGAALGMLAARAGKRTLLMETDSRAPAAATLGVKPDFAPVEAAQNFSTMILDGRHALEEYLALVVPGRAVLKAVFASRLYQFFVQAAPGLRELMMLGKVYYESEQKPARQRRWDLVIVDAPASGQALSLLRMPAAARHTFRGSIVGHESENIGLMLRDRKICAVVEVTTADSLAVAEVIETNAALKDMGIEPAALLFNRLPSAEFESADIARLERAARAKAELRHAGHLAAIARAGLAHRQQARDALERVRGEIGLPTIELPELSGISGRPLVEALAAELRAKIGTARAGRPVSARTDASDER
jgi:Mrp family chromosome partitioning ATPase